MIGCEVLPARWRARTPFGLLLAIGVGGCMSRDHLAREAAPMPPFDAIVFFSGRTEGRGSLKVAFHRAIDTLVEGDGKVAADGSMVLDQTVKRGNRPPTHREWHLRVDGPGRYVGTLSDAVGPVVGTVGGNRLHIAFAMRGGLKAVQWLYLEPNGQVAHNVMIVRKGRMPLARLDETITRIAE